MKIRLSAMPLPAQIREEIRRDALAMLFNAFRLPPEMVTAARPSTFFGFPVIIDESLDPDEIVIAPVRIEQKPLE